MLNNNDNVKTHIENMKLDIPKILGNIKDNFYFVPHKPHGVSKDYHMMPLFKKPIEVCMLEDKKLYRVIPRFPYLIVSEDSIVRDIYENFTIVNTFPYGKYIGVVSNTIKSKHRGLLLHRLVALAWVDNDDFVTNNIVDHIDDDKHNNHKDNLVWISNARNVSKTANFGTRYRWITKNMKTGEIKNFHSFTELGNFLGRNKNSYSAERCPFVIKHMSGGIIVEDRLNFKGWKLEGKYDIYGNRYRYKLNGIYYPTLNAISNIFKKRFDTPEEAKEYFDKKGYVFESLDEEPECDTIYVKNIKTDEVLKFKTVKEIMENLGFSKSTIQTRLTGNRKGRLIDGKWLLKFCHERWPDIKEEHKSKSISIKVTNEKTGSEIIFNSLREAGSYLNMDKGTLKKYMLNNSKINGYVVSLVSND